MQSKKEERRIITKNARLLNNFTKTEIEIFMRTNDITHYTITDVIRIAKVCESTSPKEAIHKTPQKHAAKCPMCGQEHFTNRKGTRIYCNSCRGKLRRISGGYIA
jgi:Zn finger protein HypA/HybF involved in hydrogenase expression